MLLKYKDATCNRSEADDSIEIKPLPGGRWRLGMIAGSFVRRRGILSARSTGSPLGVILLPDSPSRSVVCKYLLVVYEACKKYETQALLRAVVSKVLPSC